MKTLYGWVADLLVLSNIERTINSEIENSASSEEQEAIELIDMIALRIEIPNPYGIPPNYPRPGSNEWARDVVKMRTFLTKHPNYNTHNARVIKKFYGF